MGFQIIKNNLSGLIVYYSVDSSFGRESHEEEDPQRVLSSMQNSMWGGEYLFSQRRTATVADKSSLAEMMIEADDDPKH